MLAALENYMQQRGIQKAEQGDLRVNVRAEAVEEVLKAPFSMSPNGNIYSGAMVSQGAPLGIERSAEIDLQLVDASSMNVVWWGQTLQKLKRDLREDEVEDLWTRALEAAMAEFPPQ